MVLVDWQIRKLIESGKIGITPYDDSLVQPNSLDIRLGTEFVRYCNFTPIDVRNPDTISEGADRVWLHSIDDKIEILPREFLLAETKETVSLPDNIVATIEGRSSLARLGISLHQTGGWIDAGFTGTITLELFNANNRPVYLYPDMRIGQLVFHKTRRCAKPYGDKHDSHYQYQKGAVLSRF